MLRKQFLETSRGRIAELLQRGTRTVDALATELRLTPNAVRAQLTVMDVKAPCPLAGNARKLNLRIFVDRSVLEVVANDTVWVTKTIPLLDAKASLNIKSDGGAANFKLVQVWPLKTIW